MRFEPKIIFNPTEKEQEFTYGGMVYVFQPGEKRNLDGHAADHLFRHVNNSPLREYIPGDDNFTTSSIAYDEMPYRKLVSLAAKRGLHQVGMKKNEIIEALVEDDG